jgi:hypothetical protein
MISTVTGLAYTANGVPIKMALSVLPIYGIYALTHLLCAAIRLQPLGVCCRSHGSAAAACDEISGTAAEHDRGNHHHWLV